MNKVITIDGPSASGKGTLAILLAERLNWKILDSGALYRAFAYFSISENDEKLIESLKLFQLFDEDDYDLTLLISNRTLSSGQMQKISFIRALLSNTELLLLDESTSNLDSDTRQLISKF